MGSDSSIIGVRNDKAGVVFVARGLAERWPDIAALNAAAIDREQARFRSGVDTWIVQSYLRLAAGLQERGLAASIAERFVRDSVCVAHRDDLNRYSDPLHGCYVVGVRADRPPLCVARLVIVQNGLSSPRPSHPHVRTRFIPFWPQPGLIPRDASRGARIERAVYLGRAGSAPAWYRDGRLHSALAELRTHFEIRERAWNDYTDVDVLVAQRDASPTMLLHKPASKLVNAWIAGVPAILAPEPAYSELRRSPLDYFEARDVSEVVAAVRTLLREPARYRAMVENGRARARDYDVPAVSARWLDLLSEEAAAAAAWRLARPPWPVRYATHLWDMSRQKLMAKAFRRRERRELGAIRSRATSD